MKTPSRGLAGTARVKVLGDEIIITRSDLLSPTSKSAQVPAPDPIEVFRARAEARALLFINGGMSLHEAVDGLQAAAEQTGLVDQIGQDAVQLIMGAAFADVRRDIDAPDDVHQAHSTAASTINAFWLVVAGGDPERLKAWLAAHPTDAGTLRKILDDKRCR